MIMFLINNKTRHYYMINKYIPFINIRLPSIHYIFDWYHLDEKCKPDPFRLSELYKLDKLSKIQNWFALNQTKTHKETEPNFESTCVSVCIKSTTCSRSDCTVPQFSAVESINLFLHKHTSTLQIHLCMYIWIIHTNISIDFCNWFILKKWKVRRRRSQGRHGSLKTTS